MLCERNRLAGEAIPVGIQSLPKDNFLFHGSIFSCQGIIFVEKRFEPIMCLTNHRSLVPFFPCCWLPQECHIFMDAADRSASVGSAAGKFYSNQPGLNRAIDAKWAMKNLVVCALIGVYTTQFYGDLKNQSIRSIPVNQLVQWNVILVLKVAPMTKRSQNCCETLGNFI